MPQRLIRALLTCALLFNAPEALAACLPDPPTDGDDVVCDGVDEMGYDGTGATGLTITTSGVTEINDDDGIGAALLLSDDNTVIIGMDATVAVAGAGSAGVLGNNDNAFENRGTISVSGVGARGISLNENTTGVLPNGVANSGTIEIQSTAIGGIAIETGANSGSANFGTINLDADGSRGISAGDRTDYGIASNITNHRTINVGGMGAIGILAGDGWVDGPIDPIAGVPIGPGVRNIRDPSFAVPTINVSGANAMGIMTGNNSFVVNTGLINVTGDDAVGVSLGGNDIFDRADLSSGNLAGRGSFIIASEGVFGTLIPGSLIGGDNAGPLVEFRGSVPGRENRLLINENNLLSASLTNQGMPNRGIAVMGTSGDELVQNFGTLQGDVQFGDGDDRYLHSELAVLNGQLYGDAGFDELILGGFQDAILGAGGIETFDVSQLVDFDRIQISGGAGWILENTDNFAGDTEIAEGGRMVVPVPITLDGDFSIDPTGRLDVTLESAAPEPLILTGAASVDGTLVISSGATLTPSMTPYRVITSAGGLSGQFSTVESAFSVDRFTPIYDATGLSVLFEQSLLFPANGSNQRSIAQHLEAIENLGGASADLQAFADDLMNATGDLSNTYNVLSPEAYDFQTQVVVESGRRIANLLLDRPRECETGQQDPWGRIDKRLPCHSRSWAPWLAGIGGFRSREGFDEHRRYDSEMGGLVFGIDSHPIENVDLTFAISSQRGKVNAAGAGESTLTFTDISGHAAWSHGRIRTQVMASWGHGFHQDRRLIYETETNTMLNVRGTEDHDSDRITAAAEIGMLFDVAQFQVEPLVGVDWAWVYQRPIHESGAGGFGMRIASRDDSVGSINAGVRLSTTYQHSRYLIRQLEWMDGIWKPSLEVRWRQVVHGDDRDIDARFQGSPDTVPDFRVSGDEDDGGAEIGAGISFTPKGANRLQFDVRYDAFVGEHTVEHDLVGRVMIGF